jgi:hypothetical protein
MPEVIKNASRVEIEIDLDALRQGGFRSISNLATATRHNVLFTIEGRTAVLKGDANLKVDTGLGHIQVENELGEIVMSPQRVLVKSLRVDSREIAL